MKKIALGALVILAVSFVTHFARFGEPAEAVFDEIYFSKFVEGYFTGNYFFDIHPPLGKLLIAGAGKLAGFKPQEAPARIGAPYADRSYLALRALPALAGALLPLVVFFLARLLLFSDGAAFFAGLLTAVENSLVVQSRFILLDSLLLLFGFAGLLCYFWEEQRGTGGKITWRVVASALLFAGALSIKWTGLSFLGLALLLDLLRRRWARIAAYLLIPAAVYVAVFAVHFALLPHSGPGDPFMTPAFQKTLAGSRFAADSAIRPENFSQKFVELNKEMYAANKNLAATHPYSSAWYTWPFLARPLYYWNKMFPGGLEEKIYYLGNPLIYWLTALAVAALLGETIAKRIAGETEDLSKRRTGLTLLAGYFANLLPFIFIGRVMFLYHYEAALVFAVLALAFLLDRIPDARRKRRTFALLGALAVVAFLFFAPFTYGLPLSQAADHLRFWFPSWQ